jgi:hypothetical protein
MLGRIAFFARACFHCRLAWILTVLHAAWFLTAIANVSPPSPQFGDFLDERRTVRRSPSCWEPFHFADESNLLKGLLVADLPATMLASPLSLVMTPLFASVAVPLTK